MICSYRCANKQIETEAEEQAGKLIEQFRKENPGLEEYVTLFFTFCAPLGIPGE